MKTRDIKIDIFKGLLVIGMIYCHLLQFFCDLGSQPLADHITGYINAVTFSGFVFAFGYTSEMTYFAKPFRLVWVKMLKAFLRLLAAFYISGLAFRLFVEHRELEMGLVMEILLLMDIPGWSEFIVSFALFILAAMVFFGPIKRLTGNKAALLTAAGLILLTSFMPYDRIATTQLGLLIGTTRFASFPVLQHMPLFLLGMYVKHYDVRPDLRIGIIGAGLSSVSVIWMAVHGMQLPNRFPPSLFWLILPSFALYLYFFLARHMENKNWPAKYLVILGQNSMTYLLLSNLIIFALKGVRVMPRLDGLNGFGANIMLLAVITFMISMVRPFPKPSPE